MSTEDIGLFSFLEHKQRKNKKNEELRERLFHIDKYK